MTTTPKKAPTASECLLELLADIHEARECYALGSLGWSIVDTVRGTVFRHIAAAERAEAEAAQEPGDSVEGLISMCDTLDAAAAERDYSNVGGLRCCVHDFREELALELTPAAAWLDTATFEEMEPWLPEDYEVRWSDDEHGGGYYVAPHACRPAGFDETLLWATRASAVRAYLQANPQANPELWKDRR